MAHARETTQAHGSHLKKRVIFRGRLALYKYYDMGQVIGNALASARRELSGVEDASA
jgi:UDP-galactopyranose mutase